MSGEQIILTGTAKGGARLLSGTGRTMKADDSSPRCCDDEPIIYMPWMSVCHVMLDTECEQRWSWPPCATLWHNSMGRLGRLDLNVQTPIQPWVDQYKAVGSEAPYAQSLWCGRGGFSDIAVTEAEMLAYLRDGTFPSQPYNPCGGEFTIIYPQLRCAHLQPWPNFAEWKAACVYICWRRDEPRVRMIGTGAARLWRAVEVYEGEHGNMGGAHEPCCADFSSDLTLRPAVQRYHALDVELREAPGPLTTRLEMRGSAVLSVEIRVPGLANTLNELQALVNGAPESVVCSIACEMPIVQRESMVMVPTFRRSGDFGFAWQGVTTRLGGAASYECHNEPAGSREYVAPLVEEVYVASGFSPAESDVRGCVQWHPLGANDTNGVWTAQKRPAMLYLTVRA